MQKEARARLKINKLLEEAGWRLLDSPGSRANVIVEGYVKKKGHGKEDEFGDDYEKVYKGFVDYQLLDEGGFPVCVLEAKSEDKDPLIGKEQARDYANFQKARFIILSNGNIHYFWDKETGNPTRISHFPSLKHLKDHKAFSPDPDKLIDETVSEDYIVLTQSPRYQQDPRWNDKAQRANMIEEQGLKFLRRYQLEAVKTIQQSVSEGKNRFLFEMATGTGKTLVAAAIIKLYLRSGNARRILFLVDRLELETQAHKAFKKYLSPDFHTVIFKENRDDWRKAEVVVTTVQSLSYENKYLKLFSPNDFDLVISDEAHRSISGNSRAIFEYFLSVKLGLTATPRDYLKNLNIAGTDPRELERRILLSTYKTFGCESGVPTFRYSLTDGVKDNVLVNPVTVDCRTEITTRLLSDEGYAVQMETKEGEEEEVIYKQKDFERKFFSERTNHEFVKAFMTNALKDPVTKEIGKTIFFCVSRKHAAKITQLLNEYAHKMYPGKYNSDFAVQVTSDIPSAQQMTVNFANNNLNGHTKFLEGYKSSKARVCVTVGMMTTGYDCEDILNLCMARPIFSPTDFIQIKGRGTRKFIFKWKNKDVPGSALSVPKKNFKLFDFFANCEYFEEKYDYDQVIELPPTGGGGGGPPGPLPQVTAVDIEDPLKTLKEVVVDESGMRIDREMYRNKFESTVKGTYEKDAAFKEAVDSGDYEEMETFVKENLFNKPEEFFNLDRIRQSYSAERRLGLWEILDKIFGRIQRFKTREELAEEEFEKYSVNETVPPELFYETRELFKLYLIDENFRVTLNQNRLNEFASDPELMHVFRRLGKERLARIPEYIKDNVSINKFTN